MEEENNWQMPPHLIYFALKARKINLALSQLGTPGRFCEVLLLRFLKITLFRAVKNWCWDYQVRGPTGAEIWPNLFFDFMRGEKINLIVSEFGVTFQEFSAGFQSAGFPSTFG